MQDVMEDMELVQRNLRQRSLMVDRVGLVRRNNKRDGIMCGAVDRIQDLQDFRDGENSRHTNLDHNLEMKKVRLCCNSM
jgi:hypothetical protein